MTVKTHYLVLFLFTVVISTVIFFVGRGLKILAKSWLVLWLSVCLLTASFDGTTGGKCGFGSGTAIVMLWRGLIMYVHVCA